ncbi:uncharacterized protein CBL_02415 [Carabus blaptoides fortunei]
MIKLLICLIVSVTICYAQTENVQSNVTVSYTLWIGSYLKLIHNINVSAPKNTSFYEVMQLAAEQNCHYKFQAKEYDIGHYITEIGGWREIPSLRYHWMIYKIPALPNPWKPPTDDYLTPVGVDQIYVDDGEYYLFWYHKLKKWNSDNEEV